jgi:hypothetical protein
MLDVWPPLFTVINQSDKIWQPTWGTNNTVATLKHNGRIPVLTDLWLESDDETVSVDPDLFLGGSAPRLPVGSNSNSGIIETLFRRPLTISLVPDIFLARGDGHVHLRVDQACP